MPHGAETAPNEPTTSAALPAPPAIRRPIATWKRLLIGSAATLTVFLLWQILTSFVAYTGDAYVRSALIAVAPQVTGRVYQIVITDNQFVHKDDLLAKIDPEPFLLAMNAAQEGLQADMATAVADADSVAAAQDDLQAAQAALTDAGDAQQRNTILSREGFASNQSLDTTTAVFSTARATVDAARAKLARAQSVQAAASAEVARDQAQLNLAKWQLGQTVLRAPSDGSINNLTLRVGDTAYADTPLIGIVSAEDWRVIANFKQDYLASFRPGATAWVLLDTQPWHLYRAQIRGISHGISRQQGDTGLLPYVSPSTDWIRLEHRFPVTLDLVQPPPNQMLFMGADARCLIFP